jgi:uncharacterized membrane protein YfcA
LGGDGLLIVAGAASAGFVQGLTGFGFGLVAMSFWAWGLVPQQAAVLALTGALGGQLLAACTVRRGAHWRRLWPFVAGGLLGLPFGLWLLPQVDVRGLRLIVGGLLTVWCPLMLWGGTVPRLQAAGRAGDLLAGVGGGLLAPLGGFTGVVPTLWCTLRAMDRDEQRAVIQNFNLAILLVTAAASVQRGLITSAHLPQIALVVLALALPAWLGMRVYLGISPQAFRRAVLALLTLSGLAMLASALS